jgi:hypothetical protein
MGCGSLDSESDQLRSWVLDADFRCCTKLPNRDVRSNGRDRA